MNVQEIISEIKSRYKDIVVKETWGETSFFYNPGNRLPNGVYFTTLKEKDGENDSASNLNRERVFRLSIGVGKDKYVEIFGPKPPRPAKGKAVELNYDFTELNKLSPHPVYAWMGWVCILSPSKESFDKALPLIDIAYNRATKKVKL
jgi:hypothetical protein